MSTSCSCGTSNRWTVGRLWNRSAQRLHFSEIPAIATPYLVIGAVVGAQHASQMHFLWHSNRGSSDPSSRRLAMSARTSLTSWNIGLRDDPTFFVRPGASPAVGTGAIHVDNLSTVSQHDLNFLDATDLLLGQNTGQLEHGTYDQHGPSVRPTEIGRAHV